MERDYWHPADIIAALRKRGTTLAALSRQHGLAPWETTPHVHVRQ
ncbi:helix-turn-helix domain-containing protein [Dickeya oryzae]|nr:helix-turn-helix domain-containing protein [Dickeya oryzae]